MKALVGAFNQEKALIGAFSVIVQPVVEPMDRFTALLKTDVVLLPEELQHGVQDGGGVERAGGGVVLGIAGAAPHRHLQQPAAAAVCWEEYIARPKPDQNPAQFCAYKTVTLKSG